MKIMIVGMGKMGKWFAQNLSTNNEIAVFDVDRNKLSDLENIKILATLEEVKTFEPQIFLNAVSLEKTIEIFQKSEKLLDKDCVFVDIASIKNGLEKYYNQCPFKFCSIHPMFGPNFTDMKSIQNENVIFMDQSDPKIKKFFEDFFWIFKLNIQRISFDEHDQLMAYSLTLPFTSSIVFSACLGKTDIIPGTTFKRHKDIADRLFQEENNLLTEILFNSASIQQILKICSNLEYLKHIILGRDTEEMEKFLNKLREKINS